AALYLDVAVLAHRAEDAVETLDERSAFGERDIDAVQLVDEIVDLIGEVVDRAHFQSEADGAQGHAHANRGFGSDRELAAGWIARGVERAPGAGCTVVREIGSGIVEMRRC